MSLEIFTPEPTNLFVPLGRIPIALQMRNICNPVCWSLPPHLHKLNVRFYPAPAHPDKYIFDTYNCVGLDITLFSRPGRIGLRRTLPLLCDNTP